MAARRRAERATPRHRPADSPALATPRPSRRTAHQSPSCRHDFPRRLLVVLARPGQHRVTRRPLSRRFPPLAVRPVSCHDRPGDVPSPVVSGTPDLTRSDTPHRTSANHRSPTPALPTSLDPSSPVVAPHPVRPPGTTLPLPTLTLVRPCRLVPARLTRLRPDSTTSRTGSARGRNLPDAPTPPRRPFPRPGPPWTGLLLQGHASRRRLPRRVPTKRVPPSHPQTPDLSRSAPAGRASRQPSHADYAPPDQAPPCIPARPD